MKTDFLLPGVKRIILDNGLRVLLANGPKPRKNVIMVSFKVGSGYENNDNAGLFHFLEHILFKSTKARKGKQIIEELENEGTKVNAATDHQSTILFAKMLPHLAERTLQSFFEMVANPEYNARELDLEKKVVLDEMSNDQDDHAMRLADLLFSSLFPGKYFGRPILGYFHTVKAITKADLERTKKDYYIPNNMAIVVVGRVDEDEILKTIQDTFGKLEPGVLPPPLLKIEIANSQTIKMIPREGLESQAYLCLGYKVMGSNHRDYPKLLLLDSVLSGGMSSRLFIALREQRGIGYHVGTELLDFGDIGVFFAFIPGFYKKRLREAIRIILAEFQNLKHKAVSPAELERAKSRFLSSYEEALEEPQIWASQILMKEFSGTPYDFRRLARHIKNIGPSDIQKTAQQCLTDDYTLTVLLPKGFTPFK